MKTYAFCIALLATPLFSCTPVDKPLPRRSVSIASRQTPATRGTFAKGDDFESVRTVMGNPEDSQEMKGGVTTWSYKFSTITFRGGRVAGWNNASKNLRFSGAGETDPQLAGGSEPANAGNSAGTSAVGVMSNELAESINSRNSSARAPGGEIGALERVDAYQRSDGRVVDSYIRTRADASRTNNISARGNFNPVTGKRGSR